MDGTAGDFTQGRRALGRRVAALAVALLLPLGAVEARLVQWQVLDHERFAARAEGNTERLEASAPRRGALLWADGSLAAADTAVFAIELTPLATLPEAEVPAAVAAATGVTVADVARRLRARDPATRAAADGARGAALRRTCGALADAIGVPLDALLARAAAHEADTLVRVSRYDWARLAGAALRRAGVADGLAVARRAGQLGAEAHRAWITGTPAPALQGAERRERLAELAAARRSALASCWPAAPAAQRRLTTDLAQADQTFEQVLTRLLRTDPIRVCDDVAEAAILAVEVTHAERLAGIAVVARTRRRYPDGPVGAHVLGTTAWPQVLRLADGSTRDEYEALETAGAFFAPLAECLEREAYETLEARGAFRDVPMGRTGVEAAADATLRGAFGVRVAERDARGGLRRTLLEVPARPGPAVRLTLVRDWQRAAEAALERASATARAAALGNARTQAEEERAGPGDRGAAAVVLDIETGAVLVCASHPGYDANWLVPPMAPEIAARLWGPAADGSPVYNRALQGGALAPGSILKCFALAAAYEAGLGEGAHYACTGAFHPSRGPKIGCDGVHGGAVALHDALVVSCNATFCQVGRDLGRERLFAALRAFGFGGRSGVGLPGDAAGSLPDDADPVLVAIGQGAVAVSPLQVARAMAAIANGGRLVTPHVIAGAAADATPVAGISDASLALVRDAMVDVVTRGTARGKGLETWRIAGKTGTAEQVKGVWNTAWFAGFAPWDAPRYAYAVVVERVPHGLHAGALAAPLAREVLEPVLRGGRP